MKRILRYLLSFLMLCAIGMAQTLSLGPQQNYDNVIQVTNNTHPASTQPNPSAGFYGRFVLAYQVYAGPCINAGAINGNGITSGHGGTGYAIGDLGTVNGGSGGTGNPLAQYKVSSVSSGVVTGYTLVQPAFSQPYGAGYTVSTGNATTATTGSGSGLEINITSIYSASAGPNCLVVLEQQENANWASANDSVTFASISPASSAINGTFNTIYSTPFHVYTFSIATAGSGQTGGFYFINATGGGGTGNQQAVSIPSSGTGAGTVTHITSAWHGQNYTSCPTLTISEGGTPATFNCVDSAYPGWAFNTSLASGTSYWQIATGNVSGGMAYDSTGTTWAVFARNFPMTLSQGVNYIAIRKSTDKGHTWSAEQPLLYDGAPGTFPGTPLCGATSGNPIQCQYTTGSFGITPAGDLIVVWWKLDPESQYFLTGGVSPACCDVQKCTPTSVDCMNTANWTTPVRMAITTPPNVSPKGTPYLFNIALHSSYDGSMPSGEIGVGISDGNYGWITISCDNGATWSTGTGCAGGTNTLIAVTDPTSPGFTTLPTIEYDFGWIGGTKWIWFGRNNIQAFSGGVASCFFPQLTCGAPGFGYSTDNGTTWHIQKSSLTPYHGPITTGEYGEAGMNLIKTGHGNLWTVFWIERDQIPNANLYVISSTIDPNALISNLSSWTNANLTPLWYYTINPEPSSPWATMTGPNTTSYQWVGGPGANELDTFWTSYSTYSFMDGSTFSSGNAFINKRVTQK